MAAVVDWFRELSRREQILVSIMLVLTGGVVIWLGILRPLNTGIEDAKERHRQAVERHGSILARVERLSENSGVTATSVDQPLSLFILQSAGEQGFTLGTNAARGDGQVEITIASARPVPLFSWINSLEEQGISASDLSVKSGANGTVAITATLVKK